MNKAFYALGGIVCVGLLYGAYYALSPLWNTTKADEAIPGQALPHSATTTVSTDTRADSKNTKSVTTTPIVDTPTHPASGSVRIVESEGKKYLRYENYKTINGPDIYVYIAKDLGAKDFVNLGKVKATEGNINYEIPATVDIAEYRYALTWCQQFGVLFNSADLSKITLTP